MDGTRRALQLIAQLRWAAFVVGIALMEKRPEWPVMAVLAVLCLSYNTAVLVTVSTRERFSLLGGWVPLLARLLDITLISLVTSLFQEAGGQGYLLYLFVIVGAGYSSATSKALVATTVTVVAANTASSYLAGGMTALQGPGIPAVVIQTAVIVVGAVVGLYLAKSRTYDEQAAHQGHRLQALFECAGHLTDTRDVHDVAQKALRSAVTQTSAAGGQILLIDADTGNLINEALIEDVKLLPKDADAAHIAISSAADWVRSTGRELQTQAKYEAGGDSRDQAPLAITAAPLIWTSHDSSEREILGIVMVWSVPGAVFTPSDLDLILALAALASVGIVNLKLYTNLQQNFLNTLRSLAKSLEARDEYTQGHSDRVTKVACILAERMSVPDDGIEMLRNAGPLHDIGKVGVPDAILRKAGGLTPEEWEIMRKHPTVSEEICRPLGLSEEILFLVKHHHERLDGKGYPDGLRAEDQPLLLRILALADVFDALRSKRPYRDPMPKDELIAEFNRCAGRIFDPTVVEVMKPLIENGDLDYLYAEMDAELTLLEEKPELILAA